MESAESVAESSSAPVRDRTAGIQRPVRFPIAVWSAGYLERPPLAIVGRMQGQLYFTGVFVAQQDRLVEEDLLNLRRRLDRGKHHGRVGGAGDDHGAVDDVIGEPGLRLDAEPAGVDGVTGGEIQCRAENPGHRDAAGTDAGSLRPEGPALERVGR